MKKLIVYFCSFLIVFNVFTYSPQATLLPQPQSETYDLGVGALTMGSLLLDGGAVGGAAVSTIAILLAGGLGLSIITVLAGYELEYSTSDGTSIKLKPSNSKEK